MDIPVVSLTEMLAEYWSKTTRRRRDEHDRLMTTSSAGTQQADPGAATHAVGASFVERPESQR